MQRAPFEDVIWDAAEKLSLADLRVLQLRRLRETVTLAMAVPFYNRVLRQMGLSPETIQSLDDLRRLPMTTKEDLRQHYPLGMLAVPREEIRRIHGSSGTTGKPTFVAYNDADMTTWADLCARFLTAGGLRSHHLVQIAFGYGLFTGGFGLHYGVERVGAAVVPAASGNTRRQILIMKDLQPDVLICTPSYALNIAEVAACEMSDPRSLPVRYAHFGGEPWTEDMRRRIDAALDVMSFNNYGLSEVMGPGVAGECWIRHGMHLHEDHFLVECLDPTTLEPVKPGEVGELVITTLTKQAMPMLRYRTRDLASVSEEPCPCGRTHRRMSRVMGRTDDMLIIRGVNVFPSQIEEELLRVDGTLPHYIIEINRPGTLDEAIVRVEIERELFSDEMRKLQALHDRIDREIHAVTGIRMKVDLVQPRSLQRYEGKAQRVIDHRVLVDKPAPVSGSPEGAPAGLPLNP
ncbi:MAG: phenylacetate--CoA ligase [Phycisphaeraceae bacterium]|nr:phenylacetate--CoA ligase [Phycisphaeraceae bacterium]